MAAAEYNTFSGDLPDVPPRRPSLDDCGGVDKDDFGTAQAGSPRAADWNSRTRIVHALAKMTDLVDVTVKGQVGPFIVPSVFLAASDVLTESDFAVVRNGVGDYSVTWDTTLLPSTSQRLKRAVPLLSTITQIRPTVIANGLRFELYDETGTEADGDFRFALG